MRRDFDFVFIALLSPFLLALLGSITGIIPFFYELFFNPIFLIIEFVPLFFAFDRLLVLITTILDSRVAVTEKE